MSKSFLSVRNSETAFMQMPGLYIWKKDIESVFLETNYEFSKLLGFKRPEESVGKTDYDLPCKAAESAEIFRENDRKAILSKKTIKFLEIQQFADQESKIYFVTKAPLFDGELVIGTLGYAIDITKSFAQWEYLLWRRHIKSQNLTRSYSNCCPANNVELTPRQTECLFFLLRNKTAKEIGKILNLSPRTVEDYFEQLKNKFNCQSKSELIDIAIARGFLNMIPDSIFNSQLSLILE